MNFAEVVTAVTGIVKRPDKVAEIERAINASLSDCTVRASFAYDLVETSIPVDPTLYGDTIIFNNLTVPVVTRFRKFKYVKPTAVQYYLDPIGADKIFTPGGNTQRNKYYVAGNSLTYVLGALTTALEIGYYQYAPVLKNAEEYWMLDLMPNTIIDLAAARIFRSIGDETSFRAFLATGMDSFKLNRNDYEDSILPIAR